MSVQALSCAIALRGVSSSEKLLLLALANYADDKMRCWPSQSRLAEDTCLSERTVRSLLSALEQRRLLTRTQRERADGSRASDIITLHFSGMVFSSAEGPEMISGGAEAASGGGATISGGGEVVSGLTTFEPSIEPSKKVVELVVASATIDDWPEGGTAQHAATLTSVCGPGLADPAKHASLAMSAAEISRWRRAGVSWRDDVLIAVPAMTARAPPGGPIKSWTYFTPALLEAAARRRRALTIEAPADDRVDPRRADRPRNRLAGDFEDIAAAAAASRK